jgi:hypothetical protein
MPAPTSSSKSNRNHSSSSSSSSKHRVCEVAKHRSSLFTTTYKADASARLTPLCACRQCMHPPSMPATTATGCASGTRDTCLEPLCWVTRCAEVQQAAPHSIGSRQHQQH